MGHFFIIILRKEVSITIKLNDKNWWEKGNSNWSINEKEESVELIPTDSSFVYGVGYGKDGLMKVSLRGEIYLYFDVPKKVFKEFLNAESKGSYYHKYVKGKYNSIKEEEK